MKKFRVACQTEVGTVCAVSLLAVLLAVALIRSLSSAGPERTMVDARHRHALIAEVRPAAARPRLEGCADAKNAEPSESEQDFVFDVGGRKFRSLQGAVDAAKDGDTITLTGNAYVRNPVAVRKNLNFDLNGFHLVAKNSKLPRTRRSGRFAEGSHAITIFGGKQVTVENGFIDVDSNGGAGGFSGAVEVVPDPTVEVAQESANDDRNFDTVLRDLEVMTDASRDAAFRNAEGKMLIDNCTVSSTGGNGSYTIGQGSETTIRDCEFNTTGTSGECSWWNNTIAVAFDGKTTVESGTYVTRMAEGVEGTTYGTYVYSSGGSIEVKDGEFQADQVARADKDMTRFGEEFGASEVVVKDGTLSGKMVSQQVGLENGVEAVSGISAYGGVFDNAPSTEQVPEGKAVVDYGDGTYSVENVARGGR